MLIYERNVQRKKHRTVSKSEAEKIAFLYFYISAFCGLTDRLSGEDNGKCIIARLSDIVMQDSKSIGQF